MCAPNGSANGDVKGKAKMTNGPARRSEIPLFPSVTEGVYEPESSGEECDDKADEEEEYSGRCRALTRQGRQTDHHAR
jgi:hypothetical protein